MVAKLPVYRILTCAEEAIAKGTSATAFDKPDMHGTYAHIIIQADNALEFVTENIKNDVKQKNRSKY